MLVPKVADYAVKSLSLTFSQLFYPANNSFYVSKDSTELKHPDKCGSWTFETKVSDNPPYTSDCQRIIDSLASGKNVIRPVRASSKFVIIERKGTCAFGAMVTGGDTSVKIGGQDIIRLMERAIQDFAEDETIEAKGKGLCHGDEIFIESEIAWVIFHSSSNVKTVFSIPYADRSD